MSVEIKVGQKYRVVNAEEFACPEGSVEGDVLIITGETSSSSAYNSSWNAVNITGVSPELTVVYDTDVTKGYIELISDVVEDIEGESDINTQGSSENVSEVSTESSSDMFDGEFTCIGVARPFEEDYGEILWKMIEGSSEYNGHKQIGISEMSFDTLKSLVRTLSNTCESIHNIISIRMYLEDSGNVSVNVNQDCFWGEGEHPSGHRSRLLFYVDKVTGV